MARAPGLPNRKPFPCNDLEGDFVIDLAAGSCARPAGRVTQTIVPSGRRTDAAGRVRHLQASSSTRPNV